MRDCRVMVSEDPQLPFFELHSYNNAERPPTSKSFCYPTSRRPIYEECDGITDVNQISNMLAKNRGPFSFVYHRPDLKMVFLGRDRLGRCSLVASVSEDKTMISFGKYAKHDPHVPCVKRELLAGTMYIVDYQKGGLESVTFIAADRYEVKEPILTYFLFYRFVIEGALQVPKINDSEYILTEDDFKTEMAKYVSLGVTKFDEAIKSVTYDVKQDKSPVGILFSGGVDSLLVSVAAHRNLPIEYQIDLINVAFGDGDKILPSNAPDRPQCINAYEHLCQMYPDRKFVLVLVDVLKEELGKERLRKVDRIISPGGTVLDDSIGCVLWFASRAKGVIYGTEESYTSAARLLLVGSGADELFGGYSRHRGRFENSGRAGLVDELNAELRNIGNRNLGRDDRVTSSNNRDCRIPFLDDDFVDWVAALPLEMKMDFNLPRGYGEKIFIREMLRELGVDEKLCTAPKRAMQFGTRIAKLENSKEKGSDMCARLTR
uniref:Asparagine synthetase domain-containing protein n=1 Tax=Steinernema glaseri TaxID=37863 RepID=A0A1I7YCB3_9BILA